VDGERRDDFRVTLSLATDLPRAATPSGTVEKVMVVLLQNSRQAGAREATVNVSAGAGEIEILVADDGPGVPVADRQRLFDPFFTSRRAEGGTGLGLSIARSLLAAGQARIELENSARGAAFRVHLPKA
jgi:signal transduction histidine kinase